MRIQVITSNKSVLLDDSGRELYRGRNIRACLGAAYDRGETKVEYYRRDGSYGGRTETAPAPRDREGVTR